MDLAGRRLRGLYVRAVEPSVICAINRAYLEEIILRTPEVGLRLVRSLSRRLREVETRLADLTSKDVRGRLANLILSLADKEGVATGEGVRIPTRYTQQQLATIIGSKRVPVSRAFTKLKEAGAVELRQRRIYVRNLDALRRAAGQDNLQKFQTVI